MRSFRECTIKAFNTTERCADGCDHVACPSCVTQKLEPLFREMIVQEIIDFCTSNSHATNANGDFVTCGDCEDIIGAIDTSYEDAIAVHSV